MPTEKTESKKIVAATPESSTAARTRRRPLAKALAASKPKAKEAKPKKAKLLSKSYSIPEAEYAQLVALKKRLLALGVSVKKSELLRAGLALLVPLTDARLKKVLAGLPSVDSRETDAG